MLPPDPLSELWKNYQLARDCFKITGRILNGGNQNLLSYTGFEMTSEEDDRRIIENGRNDWDDFAILSLWAVFERLVIDFVREKAKILVDQDPKEFSQNLYGFVDGQIEFWRIGDKLDLLKGAVDATLIGQAKQIKNYRDWVVHKSKTPANNVKPRHAYNILSQIVSIISRL